MVHGAFSIFFRIDILILSKNTASYNYITHKRQDYIKKNFWNVQWSILISVLWPNFIMWAFTKLKRAFQFLIKYYNRATPRYIPFKPVLKRLQKDRHQVFAFNQYVSVKTEQCWMCSNLMWPGSWVDLF